MIPSAFRKLMDCVARSNLNRMPVNEYPYLRSSCHSNGNMFRLMVTIGWKLPVYEPPGT